MWSVIPLRSEEEEPEDRGEEKIDKSSVCGHPSRLDIALQRDHAHGHLPRAAQPRRHAMAQPFVQNILEDARQRRHGNHRDRIVLRGRFTGGHNVPYSIPGSDWLR